MGEPEVERALEKKYQELVVHQMEMGLIIEGMNTLLPEADRFNLATTSEALDKLVEEAREKAIRAVLKPYKNSNVSINVKEISKELDKLCNKCFNVSQVKMIFGTYYWAAKDSLKKLLFKEADRLMPWKLESPEQLVKNRSLILRHSVTECKYSSSPDGMWQFEGHVSNLEKLIRIHTQDADPRTVRGDMLSGVYRANKSSSWDKLTFIDPVFVSSKLYKNGKFELELASGEMARNTAAFLFALDRENRVQV
ncbi:hypothetical protein METP3_02759 [Methanosarcinales archaeon]|nr:hypothetical protein METP3_02759 [Methanosarcinales archaeon]